MKIKVKPYVLSALVALLVTVVLILVLAIVLTFADLDSGVIRPINQVIKVISIFVGVLVLLRQVKKSGIVNGSILAVLYTIVSTGVFSILMGEILFGGSFFVDLVFSVALGAISGVTVITQKRRV